MFGSRLTQGAESKETALSMNEARLLKTRPRYNGMVAINAAAMLSSTPGMLQSRSRDKPFGISSRIVSAAGDE